MKSLYLFLSFFTSGGLALGGASSKSAAGGVTLDATAVKNLGIETVEAEPTTFEETLFALGRIEVIPSRRGVVSSRVAGRIAALEVFEGDQVTRGQLVARIESRQFGHPPPGIDLVAPIGGLVMPSQVSLGKPIEPDTEVMEIIDLSAVHAVARLPEDQAGRVERGMKARIHIAALPKERFAGEMIRFGTRADPVGGTLDAIFLLQDLDGSVRPEMRAEFSIILGRRENVMSIPKETIQGDGARPYVFVRDFDLPNAFVKAPVQLGARNDRWVEVLSGLFPGDEVVTTGAYALAFAGMGIQALGAGHGHAHGDAGHGHEEAATPGGGSGPWSLTLFLSLLSGLLFTLLILSFFFRRGLAPRDA